VLIVDQSADSREVLRTALERAGAKILEADGAEVGLDLVRRHHPDLIVLDLEAFPADAAIVGQFGESAQASCTPIVVLGNARRHARSVPTGEFIAKPYHYAPLIRRIEALLGASS
jgi:DNA-binding response OmpR family regulator